MTGMNDNTEATIAPRKRMRRRLDTLGCGLFFIWVGIAVLADVGWGIFLIGVGVLILGLLAAGEYLTGAAGSGTSRAQC